MLYWSELLQSYQPSPDCYQCKDLEHVNKQKGEAA